MISQSKIQFDSLTSEKHAYGLGYGLLAGFVFTFFVWGIDAIQLAMAHAMFPWLKLILGGIPVLIVSGFVGWLAYRLNNLLASFLLWLAVGLIFSWISAHMPFEIMDSAVKLIYPEIGAIVEYPFLIGASARAFIVFIAVTGLTTLAGMLQVYLVDNTTTASAPLTRILPVVFWIGLFYLAALAPDNNIYQELRGPIVGVDQLIRFADDNPIETITPERARETGYSAVKGVLSLIDRPRKLIVTGFDETLTTTHVAINFDGQWATCYVLYSRPSNCEIVAGE